MRVRVSALLMAIGAMLLAAGWLGFGTSVMDIGGVALLVTGAFCTALAMGEPAEVAVPIEEPVEV